MILDNSPALGWIRITNSVVTYKNKIFIIPDDATEMKYIYWDSNNPATFEKTNVIHPESDTKFLVLINDNGMHTIVHSKTDFFNIAFDSGIQAKVDSKILGLYEESKDANDKNIIKFSNIAQRIDGISQSVGEVKKENVRKYTELNQKIDSFELSVNDTSTDLLHIVLRDKVIKEYLTTSEILGHYEIALQGIMRDEKLDFNGTKDFVKVVIDPSSPESVVGVSEKDQIKIYNKALKEQIEKLNSVLMEVYNDKKLQETKKQELDIIKDHIIPDMNDKYENLVKLIDSACLDDIFITTEITSIYSALQDMLGTLSRNKTTVDRIISLGYGAQIIDTVGKIFLNKDSGGFDFVKQLNDNKKEIAKMSLGLNDLTIQLGEYDDKLNYYGTELKATKTQISSKVSNAEFSTKIEQLKDKISDKISSGDVVSSLEHDVNGFRGFFNRKLGTNSDRDVTFEINDKGLTIYKGYVSTAILTVPGGLSPVINLFRDEHNRGIFPEKWINGRRITVEPKIDARASDSEKPGDSIRLQMSPRGYIKVGVNRTDIYLEEGKGGSGDGLAYSFTPEGAYDYSDGYGCKIITQDEMKDYWKRNYAPSYVPDNDNKHYVQLPSPQGNIRIYDNGRVYVSGQHKFSIDVRKDKNPK